MFKFSKEDQPSVEQYIVSLTSRYNYVQVLGMREPVLLKNLFVRANILEKISSRTGTSTNELNEFFDFDRRSFGKTHETVDGELIVNKLRKFIVLGKPGAGKTTYLKYLTLMMLDYHSKIKERRLPVFVTLREWADTPMPLLDFIVQQFDICGFEEARIFLERMLRDGQCMVLFDGLDEVGEQVKQDIIIRQINDFSHKYYDNQFIISCRVAAYNHEFTGFTEVEMADFDEAQMETFIRNWFHGRPKVATECWERLKNNSSLRELASVPLLLTLLCLEYDENNDFPTNKSELYHRAIEKLLTTWDSTRRIRRPELYKKLTTKQKESMFARIAVGTFTENEYFIREGQLVRMIEKFIEHLPGFKEEELEPDSKAILKGIEAQHGIFVERAKGVYSFAHLTFQEYFTAKYIVDNAREGTLEKLVEQHLYDPKWKEVFLLVAGLLDNADELLFLMRRKSKELLEVAEINALIETAHSSLLLEKNIYSKNIRLNFAVYTALEFVYTQGGNHIHDRARALTFAVDLALVIDHSLESIIDNFLNHIFDRAFTSPLIDAFGFNHILLENYSLKYKLTEQNIKKIQNYYFSNELIINCINSANFVSKPIREKMLHEMFLPKDMTKITSHTDSAPDPFAHPK